MRWIARRHQAGDGEDLLREQAKGLEVAILQAHPQELIDCESDGELREPN